MECHAGAEIQTQDTPKTVMAGLDLVKPGHDEEVILPFGSEL
jgi:hypothetical protein